MLFREIFEAASAPLYHFMTFDKAMYVFNEDEMPARWEHDIPGLGVVRGNSFSRNPRFNLRKTVRVTVDQAKLAQRHRIIPLDGEAVFQYAGDSNINYVSSDRHLNRMPMAEEFVIGDIKPFHRYCTKIEVRTWEAVEDMHRFVTVIRSYATHYGIAFSLSSEVQSKLP